ncbi:MAG TPA: HAD family hydrolase, partial [Alphaproteobacteria bacterium]|nr:HAD family hydrolase [Alphaproteobacteria bacterium]
MNASETTREKLSQKPSAVLLDADNTLFAYEFPHAQASAAVEKRVLADFGIPPPEFRNALKKGRAAIKERLGPVASSHNRLLYFQNTLELLGYKSQIATCVTLEQIYWRTFLLNAQLFP